MDSVDLPAPSAGAGGPGPAGVSRRQLAWLLGGLMVGLFLSATESSVIATALPTMAGELGGASKLAWVVSAYLLTSTVVTPLYGKLSDLLGRRVVYQTSIGLFVLGSLLCGLAQSMNQLVAARAVQGMGGGGLMSLAFVILGDVLSPRERGRYMGLFTGVFAFSSVTGPLWGGLLVDTIGWRWIFLVMLPLGTLALAITSVGLRLPFLTRKRPIDWAGAALLVTGSSALLLVPIWGGGSYGWTSAPVLGAAGVGLALTAALLWWETKAAEPVLPLRLFRDRTVRAVFAMNFGQMFGLIAVATFLPLFLQVATGASATRSGLEMVPQSLAISGTATASGFMVSRWGRYKWTLLAGPLIAALGMASLSTIDGDTTPLGLAPYLVVTGLGLGLSFPNMTIAVQNAVDMADLGVATSTANFFRNMGSTFGAAVMGALLNNRLASTLADRVPAERLTEVGGAEGLVRSPKLVRELDPDLHDAVIEAVTSAVTFVLRLGVPIFVLMFGIALFVKEKPLRTTSVLGGAGRTAQPTAGGPGGPGAEGTAVPAVD